MANTNHLPSQGVVNGSSVESTVKTPEGHTMLILFIFFIVILSLFAIGLGLSYLCYIHSLKKSKLHIAFKIMCTFFETSFKSKTCFFFLTEKAQEEREQRARVERRQQIQYQALAAAQFFRGIPNSYSPNPKDEKTFLLGLDMSVVPMQLQTHPR